MTHVVEEFPVQTAGRGRATLYPWADWMDGQIWVVTRGEDFDERLTLDGFRQQLSGRAYRSGMLFKRIIDRENQTITFQFSPKDES